MPGKRPLLRAALMMLGLGNGLQPVSAATADQGTAAGSGSSTADCETRSQRDVDARARCRPARGISNRVGVNGVLPLHNGQPPARISGAYRVIETTADTVAHDVAIDGVNADDLQRGGIRLRGRLTNITIRNSQFRFRREPQVEPHLPACLEIGDKGPSRIEGVLIQNVTCEGFQMTRAPDKYWNGDGPAVESNVTGLVIDNLVSRNSTDGCADIKPIFRATRLTLGGCKLLLRSWRGGEVDDLRLETPIRRGGTGASGGIWVKGNPLAPPFLHIRKLTVRFATTSPIFVVAEGPAHIRVDECDIEAPAGTRWAITPHPAMQWQLGPSCDAFASP